MTHRCSYRAMPPALSVLFFAGLAAPARAGGFGISVELPDPNDARMKDAILVVRPIGCMGPGAAMSARAEGIVDGKRASLPVKLTLISRGPARPGQWFDTYTLKRQWPRDGIWALLITGEQRRSIGGKSLTAITHAVVEMESDGRARVVDRPNTQAVGNGTTLADGKTRLLRWTAAKGERVVVVEYVYGDVNAAVSAVLRSEVERAARTAKAPTG